ncbi:hypothetical protein QBC34DRAFT_17477 [Podospora aff. communis PSN243]|uniref:Thioredoxin domain-containing protein n=1 Tax=Podospora aff. communis PSN243 TaxID=3040156 RepID=A0AAV9GVZ9_9PEZI|nr:hypothetical protein QBC34DRAFT_17477 [Podospora aff. communis PSN243]
MPGVRPTLLGRVPRAGATFSCNLHPSFARSHASFSTSQQLSAKNQVFASVRNLDQFHNYQLISSSARTPLLTLWTTSWCPTCRVVSPLLQELIESGIGEAEGGVGYCTVEYDAPDVMEAGLGLTYMINSIPTLMSFDAQEAQVETKITNGRQLSDRQFLEEWIRTEARRHGDRGGGGGGGSPLSVFRSLFGKSR